MEGRKLRACGLLLLVAGCAVAPPSPDTTDRRAGDRGPGGPAAVVDSVAAMIAGGDLAAAEKELSRLLGPGGRPASPGTRGNLVDLHLLVSVLRQLPRDPDLPRFMLETSWWSPVDMTRPEVAEARRRLLADGGRGLRTWMRRASPYLPDIVRGLEAAGLPPELWVLTVVESGMRHDARSHADAIGPWQFVEGTARHTGLVISLDRDERRDWYLATLAAARYLAELRARFEDGLLALAAFNCGPSRLTRAMDAGETAAFWDLELPRETRMYVPRVLALIDLLGDGGSPYRPDPSLTLRYDEVELPYPVVLDDLAVACDVETSRLRRLNPSWLRPVSPGDGHPVVARVPAGAGGRLRLALAEERLARIPLSPDRVHRVKRGDTLWGISRRYEVKLSTLLLVNGLSGKEVIHPGRVLRLPG